MSKENNKKTNAMRILDSMSIDYSIIYYDVEDNMLDGLSVAKKTNTDPERVFKTLVLKGEKNYYVFCIPITNELDIKKASKVCGEKKIEMIKVKDIKNVTGYIRGGCSPIGMKKNYSTYIEESIILFDEILISGGMIGIQLKVNPEDIVKGSNGLLCDLI